MTALSWLSTEPGLSPREECHVMSQAYHFSEQVFFRESPRGHTQPAFTCRGDQSPKTGMGFFSVQCGVIGDLCSETPQGFGSRRGVCALATGLEADVSCFGARMLSCSVVSLCNPMDCSPPGSSVHRILQARTLEWVAMPSSGASSQPGIEPHHRRLPGVSLCSNGCNRHSLHPR